ncbi:MAG: DUF6033 family protein [Defluviitaleaceae bacterium]|nr:DUF6033 family protein [Defluviitaleaceae bacterium]
MSTIANLANSYATPGLVGDVTPYTPTFQVTDTQNFGQIFATELSNMQAHTGQPVTVDSIISELESLGASITVRAVPNNSEAAISNAEIVAGHGSWDSVTIAPNILEQMANDADARQKYTDKVRWFLEYKVPATLAHRPLSGGRLTGISMTIHEDGTVTYVVFGKAPHEIDGYDGEERYFEPPNSAYVSQRERTTDNYTQISANLDNQNHFAASHVAGLAMQLEIAKLSRYHTLPLSTKTMPEDVVLENSPITADIPVMADTPVQLSYESHKLPHNKIANAMLSDTVARMYQRSIK